MRAFFMWLWQDAGAVSRIGWGLTGAAAVITGMGKFPENGLEWTATGAAFLAGARGGGGNDGGQAVPR